MSTIEIKITRSPPNSTSFPGFSPTRLTERERERETLGTRLLQISRVKCIRLHFTLPNLQSGVSRSPFATRLGQASVLTAIHPAILKEFKYRRHLYMPMMSGKKCYISTVLSLGHKSHTITHRPGECKHNIFSKNGVQAFPREKRNCP